MIYVICMYVCMYVCIYIYISSCVYIYNTTTTTNSNSNNNKYQNRWVQHVLYNIVKKSNTPPKKRWRQCAEQPFRANGYGIKLGRTSGGRGMGTIIQIQLIIILVIVIMITIIIIILRIITNATIGA